MLKTTLKVKDNYVNAYLVPTLPWSFGSWTYPYQCN